MQIQEAYPGTVPVVKTGGQRVSCCIVTRRGVLRLAGTLVEVLDWLRAQCPGGKMVELMEVAA